MDLSEPPRDDVAATRLLRRAVDLGVALIDTADRYGDGHNEEVVGAALEGRREEVPLGIGLLTTSPESLRAEATSLHRRLRRLPRADAEPRHANAVVLAELGAIAAELECTVPQLALAWLCHRGPDVVPLPGTRRRTHLEANLAATSIEWDKAVLDRLDHQFPAGRFAGARKTPSQLALTLP